MNIESKTILITGANRGIGRALVEETLSRGAKRVYAGTRQAFIHSDERVTPVILDVTLQGVLNVLGVGMRPLNLDPKYLQRSAALSRHKAAESPCAPEHPLAESRRAEPPSKRNATCDREADAGRKGGIASTE
jgi:hypothetical protein